MIFDFVEIPYFIFIYGGLKFPAKDVHSLSATILVVLLTNLQYF